MDATKTQKPIGELKFLVVGLGSIGTRHANNLHRLGARHIYALRSRNLAPPAEILSQSLVTVTSWDEALKHGIDAVIVGNPTSLHLGTMKRALESGCHVYVDKPISNTLEGCEEALKLAEAKKLSVLVGCQLRFHPHFEKLEHWVKSGALGRIFSVSADLGEHLPDWHPWEDYRNSYAARKDQGGGVILTLIHELDYLHALFGGFKQVYALGGHLTPLEINVEDTALISLKSKQGTPIHLRMDYWRKPAVRRVHIVAEKGQVLWDYQTKSLSWSRDRETVEEHQLPENWDRNELFLAAMKQFLSTFSGEIAPRISLRDGVDVLRLALAAKQSLERGEVVPI